MEEELGSPNFVEQKFREWYSKKADNIRGPKELKKKEFAFIKFFDGIMFRHINFLHASELQQYLKQYHPAHSYYSSAYYERPEASMDKKCWLGADLVFDIDADHFELNCQKSHNRWICQNCGEEGFGNPPRICNCNKSTFKTEIWICENCLQAAKHETQKLIDILIQDFGIKANDEILCNFSGNRGYHIHVISDKIRSLGQIERREIVDHIMGTGLNPNYHGFMENLRGGLNSLAEKGWRGRLGRAIYDYLMNADEDTIKSLKLGRKATNILLEDKETLLDILIEEHPSHFTNYIKPYALTKLIKIAIKEQAAEIDTVVTTDIHRLIRIQETLHGKTGWKVDTIDIDRLSDYDPFENAIAFKNGTQKLYIKWAPKFRLGGEEYGPYAEESLELPMAAAIFILCKKGGRILR